MTIDTLFSSIHSSTRNPKMAKKSMANYRIIFAINSDQSNKMSMFTAINFVYCISYIQKNYLKVGALYFFAVVFHFRYRSQFIAIGLIVLFFCFLILTLNFVASLTNLQQFPILQIDRKLGAETKYTQLLPYRLPNFFYDTII